MSTSQENIHEFHDNLLFAPDAMMILCPLLIDTLASSLPPVIHVN
jgi:hypothetical protein